MHIYLAGDQKFYAQISGRDGMSSYWCMWCMSHPSEWRTFGENTEIIPEVEKGPWTVELHQVTLEKIRSGQLKESKDKNELWKNLYGTSFSLPMSFSHSFILKLVL